MNDPNSKAIRDSLRNIEEGNASHLKETVLTNRILFVLNTGALILISGYFIKELFL